MKPMTRKQAIEKLNKLKLLFGGEALIALRAAVRDMEAIEGGIKVKALRKKGTKYFYYLDGQDLEWVNSSIPIPYDGDIDEDKEDGGLPKDAELVDIMILIK